jgi:hypothetical protein
MAQREPTAAEAMYPHLPRKDYAAKQPQSTSLADAMWPKLSDKAKAKDELRRRERERLLRNLRETSNAIAQLRGKG